MQTFLISIGAVVILLAVVRIILPSVGLSYINKKLRQQPSTHGNVSSLSMTLLSGTFVLRGIRIAMTDEKSKIDNLIVTIPEAKINIRLGTLLRKKISAALILQSPEAVYVNVLHEPEADTKNKQALQPTQTPVASPIKKAFDKLIRFKIDLDINAGDFRYVDHTSKPQHNIHLRNLTLELRNLSNEPVHKSIPASIVAQGTLFGGILNAVINVKPLEELLTFDMICELKEAQLVKLNDYSRAYANVDVNEGTLSVYTTLDVHDGVFTGNLKPVLKNIDLIGAEDKNDSIVKKIWERLVAVAVQGLENNKLDQIATEIKIEGRLDDPHVNVLAAIGGVVRNAFIKSMQPSLENALGIKSIFRSAISGTAGLIKKVLL